MFGFSRIKLIAYGVAAIAVGLMLWRINSWRVQAGEKKAAVAALAQEVRAHKNDLANIKIELAVSEQARVKLLNDHVAIEAAFASQIASIKPKTLIVTKEVPGEPCKAVSLSPDFFMRFNAAGNVPASLQ